MTLGCVCSSRGLCVPEISVALWMDPRMNTLTPALERLPGPRKHISKSLSQCQGLALSVLIFWSCFISAKQYISTAVLRGGQAVLKYNCIKFLFEKQKIQWWKRPHLGPYVAFRLEPKKNHSRSLSLSPLPQSCRKDSAGVHSGVQSKSWTNNSAHRVDLLPLLPDLEKMKRIWNWPLYM